MIPRIPRSAWVAVAFVVSEIASLSAAEAPRKVLCTTFPIYQITRNVTQGRDAVTVSLLLPAELGCPHDYALTPQDMQKLTKADVLIVNGLGLEEFLGAPVERANPRLVQIDSSSGITAVLPYMAADEGYAEHGEHEAEEHGHKGTGKDEVHGTGEQHGPQAEEGHERRHHRTGANPHLFASPRLTASIARNIAAGLAKVDPAGAGVYEKSAAAYASRMETLADEFAAAGKRLANVRIVQPHGVFDYLARDMGLEVVAVLQPHGQEPSAAEMLRLAQVIRDKRAGAIFTEPQYPARIGETFARETGIRVAALDPVASGPENAGLDYYEKTMRTNLDTIRAVLGETP